MRRGAPLARETDHYAPSAQAFGRFVAAAGRRYSGTYVTPGTSSPIPRVNYWSIWNEPTNGRTRSAFVAHPGLFAASGFAHHPYSFFLSPAAEMSDRNFVPLSDLGRFERGLDRIFAAYAVARRPPIYLTEYGYETSPPNPFRGVSPSTQAAYL